MTATRSPRTRRRPAADARLHPLPGGSTLWPKCMTRAAKRGTACSFWAAWQAWRWCIMPQVQVSSFEQNRPRDDAVMVVAGQLL